MGEPDRDDMSVTAVAAADERSDTRQRLIDAAVDLFLTVGYPNLRVVDITNHACVGKGTFYLYFESKRDLLLAYFRHIMEVVDATANPMVASATDYFEREGIRISGSLERGVNWNSMLTFLRVSAGSPDPQIVSAARELRERIGGLPGRDLAEAIRAGVSRPVDIELATLMMVGMTEALAWRSRQDDTYDAPVTAAFLRDLHRRTLTILGDEDPTPVQAAAMVQRSEQVERAIDDALPATVAGAETVDTRQRIIDSAVDLLHRVGYGSLRVDDIAEHAGVGKGTFYHHFASKQDVLLAFFERVARNIGDVEAQIADAELDYPSKVALRMRLWLEPSRHWDRIVTFARIMAGSGTPEIAEGARQVFRSLVDAGKRDIEQAMRAGLVRRLDPELAITAILGMGEVLVWRSRQDDAYDPATVLAFMADMFCRAFFVSPAG
jgi:AcrR family transcriptional regulator